MKKHQILLLLTLLCYILLFAPSFSSAKGKVKKHPKNQYLANASFQIKQPLNHWNFTLSLSCNRILLESEIKNSKITIYPKKRPNQKITASFGNLSKNGKVVSYTFSPTEQKKLCPKNRSMDGSYYLTCTHFSKKLSFSYQERIPNQALSGFVFYPDGNPVSIALISLKTKKSAKKTLTDKNGHYNIKSDSKKATLTVTKSGFLGTSLSIPSVSSPGTICENIVLHPKDTASYLSFSVTDSKDHPISNASLSLVKAKAVISANPLSDPIDSVSPKDIVYLGTTDADGTASICNTNNFATLHAGFTKVTADSSVQLSYSPQNLPDISATKTSSSDKHSSSSSARILSAQQLNLSEQYTLYVHKNNSFLPQKLSFSLSDFVTDQISFHIRLAACPDVTLSALSFEPTHRSSLSACQKASLTFFQNGQKTPIYHQKLGKESLTFYDSFLKTSAITLPCFLENVTYYVQFRLYDAFDQVIEASTLFPMTVCNKTFCPKAEASFQTIALFPTYYTRFLVYGNFALDTDSILFSLYQKENGTYYKTDTIAVEPISKIDHTTFCTNLIAPNLLADKDYLLVSADDTIYASPTAFTAKAACLFSSKKEAQLSIAPLSKISCTSASKALYRSDSNEPVSYTYHTQNTITTDQIRSCQTYLNTVVAFYHKNGTLIQFIITDPATAKSPSFLSQKAYTICDIYTNHALLSTTQPSY